MRQPPAPDRVRDRRDRRSCRGGRAADREALRAWGGDRVARGFWDWHGRIEAHLRASGVPAVVLRPTFNMTNLFGSAEAVQYTASFRAGRGEGSR